jgi:hypothetical protein
VQREMLGPGKYDLYQKGQIGLADLVGVTHDPQWGTVRYQRSIRELRAKPPEAS